MPTPSRRRPSARRSPWPPDARARADGGGGQRTAVPSRARGAGGTAAEGEGLEARAREQRSPTRSVVPRRLHLLRHGEERRGLKRRHHRVARGQQHADLDTLGYGDGYGRTQHDGTAAHGQDGHGRERAGLRRLGDRVPAREREDGGAAARGALDAGLNVIDTAECYEDSEELIGKALGARRGRSTSSPSADTRARRRVGLAGRGAPAQHRAQPEAARHRPARPHPAPLVRARGAPAR